MMTYQSFQQLNAPLISQLKTHYHFDFNMVVSSGHYDLTQFPCIVAFEAGRIAGVLIYRTDTDILEIISLDSFRENKGIRSQLIQHVENIAQTLNIQTIQVITTNENIKALYFYQKNGYRMSNIRPNAVDIARHIKPSIPLIGDNGIPIKDEIQFTKYF
ncbi:GNAT family N-acetyltransferase [Staphylococcus intermedius]|nr:GNAT family N-acetyltransferase [Staphylococcus intermedius]